MKKMLLIAFLSFNQIFSMGIIPCSYAMAMASSMAHFIGYTSAVKILGGHIKKIDLGGFAKEGLTPLIAWGKVSIYGFTPAAQFVSSLENNRLLPLLSGPLSGALFCSGVLIKTATEEPVKQSYWHACLNRASVFLLAINLLDFCPLKLNNMPTNGYFIARNLGIPEKYDNALVCMIGASSLLLTSQLCIHGPKINKFIKEIVKPDEDGYSKKQKIAAGAMLAGAGYIGYKLLES